MRVSDSLISEMAACRYLRNSCSVSLTDSSQSSARSAKYYGATRRPRL